MKGLLTQLRLISVRFLITWEGLEHKGPGQHDHAYLKYIKDLLSLFPQYGMVAMVSMHQDVWSRFSGGSGAPAWTLEAAGFNLETLEVSGAAYLDGVRDKKLKERGVWPTGYQKLAAATMSYVGLLCDAGVLLTRLQDLFLGRRHLFSKTPCRRAANPTVPSEQVSEMLAASCRSRRGSRGCYWL